MVEKYSESDDSGQSRTGSAIQGHKKAKRFFGRHLLCRCLALCFLSILQQRIEPSIFGFLEKNSGCLREAFRETIEKEANQFIYNKITWIQMIDKH